MLIVLLMLIFLLMLNRQKSQFFVKQYAFCRGFYPWGKK